MTTYEEPLCDLRESAISKHITITHRAGGKTVREQHWILGTGPRPYIAIWDVRTYLPGRGRFQVGDRLVYTGKGKNYVQAVPLGTEAVITHDYGFDYRYMLDFGKTVPSYISTLYPEGEFQHTGIRTSGGGWTKIDNDE